ncbi:hypothetical protein KAW55_03210 [bacterium]|nr:hypothetical protein [bacterium]
MTGVTRKRAFEIAWDYLLNRPIENCVSVGQVLPIDELVRSEPCIYGYNLDDYWLAYAKRPFKGLHSSQVLLISKVTGEVVYAGSANDEG